MTCRVLPKLQENRVTCLSVSRTVALCCATFRAFQSEHQGIKTLGCQHHSTPVQPQSNPTPTTTLTPRPLPTTGTREFLETKIPTTPCPLYPTIEYKIPPPSPLPSPPPLRGCRLQQHRRRGGVEHSDTNDGLVVPVVDVEALA